MSSAHDNNETNDIICGCSGTTRQEVVELIRQGVADLDRISRVTGALSGCGGCEFELEQLLKSHRPKP